MMPRLTWNGPAFLLCGLVVSLLVAPAYAQQGASSEDAYQAVKPIFDRSCSGCHVSGGHAGGLRMDSFSLLLKGGEDGAVLVPGKPEQSMLSKAVHYSDSALQMPPRGKLSAAEIAVIDGWIKTSAAPLAPAPSAPASAAAATTPALTATPVALASTPLLRAEQEQFFEISVRPILVNNCYSCHASAAKGGLRLDSRQAVLQGGKDGPVVAPGHPEQSVLSSAAHYGDTHLQMPPRKALKPEEVATLDQWIKDGLPWPASSSSPVTATVTAAQRNFWSFQPPVRPAVPQVQSPWVINDIDRFVLARLREKKLTVGADADQRTLLRRVTYDLTGLPPTFAETEAFLADRSPQAYEHVVDRLLASSAYGERWGRIWLDVVRYADTTGGGGDFPVPELTKYRDYVIRSFNQDKPYDRFVREQIAGDLLPASSEEEHWQNIIATGYLAGASTNDNAQIADAVDNLGYAFLGTTVACARCHDHKFDPIPTSDYYALAGILKSTHFPKAGNDNVRYQTEFVYRNPKALQQPELVAFQAQLKPIANAIAAVVQLPGTYDDLLPQLERRRMNLWARAPALPESAYAVTEGTPLQAQIQVHGDPTNLGDEVPRGFLQVLGGSALPAETKGSGRLELANWIASSSNPLTARVLVNRLWLGHFGRGIVATPNNFGTRGVPPSDQALLDFLATELVAKNWSIKALQREILLSHAYRLSTASTPANDDLDPDNLYLWRHNRVRLDAEEIRDSLLADSRLLDRTPAGPHPFPPQSEWNWEEQNPFVPNLPRYENDHRTVYTLVQRSVKHPYMTLFDGADANASTEQRSSSLTPLQALYFLNSTFPKRCADNLARQLTPTPPAALQVGRPGQPNLVDEAFQAVYSRPPAPAERVQSGKFLEQMTARLVARGASPADARRDALSHLLQAMFASNEFMFVE